MKFIAYVRVQTVVPVEVEVDDKWKPMEDYGNAEETTEAQDDWFEDESWDCQDAVEAALDKANVDYEEISYIETMAGNECLSI